VGSDYLTKGENTMRNVTEFLLATSSMFTSFALLMMVFEIKYVKGL
jgi:hypothetical protein